MTSISPLDPQYVATRHLTGTQRIVVESTAQLLSAQPDITFVYCIARDHQGQRRHFLYMLRPDHTEDSPDLAPQELADPAVLAEPHIPFVTINATVTGMLPDALLHALQPSECGHNPDKLVARMMGQEPGQGLWQVGADSQPVNSATWYFQAVMRIVQNPRDWRDWFEARAPRIPPVVVAAVAQWYHTERYATYCLSPNHTPTATFVKSAYGAY